MYSKNVMDRFKEPKNIGTIKNASGVGTVGNAKCGDILKIYLQIENNIITDAKFKTFGCVAAIASMDIAVDLIKGKSIEDALKVTNKQILDLMGTVPQNKIHCSVLAQEAIAEAVDDYHKQLEKEAKKQGKK